jgi:hypothetical protein
VDERVEDTDLVTKVRAWFKESKEHYSDWRNEAKEDYKFRAGDQWSDEDKALLEEQGRPCIVFNRTAPLINSVSGFESTNRQEVRYRPRTLDDSGVNENYTNAAKFFRDECDAEDEESDAFKDVVTCGIGWTETHVDYEDDPEGMIKVERVTPLEMYPDAKARKQNLADARYAIRLREYTKEDFEAIFGDIEVSGFLDDPANDESEPNRSSAGDDYNRSGQNTKTGKYYVLHCQYWERESYYRVVSGGRIIELAADRFEKIPLDLTEQLLNQGRAVKLTRKVYKQAIVCGDTLLSSGPGPCQGHLGFQCITGFRDEMKGTWIGVMRAMKDPQRWSNKFLSQFLDIVNSNSKGGVFVEEGAVSNVRKFEENYTNPSGVNWLKEGGLGKIKERQMSVFPASIDRLLEIAVAATRDVAGINLEFIGMANRDQAGMLETERKRAALVVLSDIFNSLRRYRKMQGRVFLYFIDKYIPEGRIIRIVGEEGTKYAPLMKDKEVMKYDVIVDTAPTSPNMKTEVWNILSNILPAMIKAGVPVPPDIIKFLPLPTSIAESWMEYIKSSSQPSPEQQQQQQIAMAQEVAEVGNTQADTALKTAKAQKEAASIGTDVERVKLETFDRHLDDVKTAADIVKPGGGGIV